MYAIGVDIGASKILGVVARHSQKGIEVIQKIKIMTPQKRGEFLHELYELIATLCDVQGNRSISSVGIAIAGVVDPRGRVRVSPNMEFLNGFNLYGYFSHKLGKPLSIVNDARASLLYSVRYGVARGRRDVVGLVLGSGVGGAIVIGGELVKGAHNGAGEVGHMIMDIEAHKGKWNVKSLESLASVKALRVGSGYAELGEYLGMGLANIANILDPEMIVVGGGLASAGDLILVRAKNIMKRHILSPKAKEIPVVIERDYEIASAVGATLN